MQQQRQRKLNPAPSLFKVALVILALAGLAISVGAAPVPPPTTDSSDCVIQQKRSEHVESCWL
ncbi:hypothetical protein GY45DRAFT_1374483 [Cubamyces sp. BRFM 1775]|nr:hypothetical protein GY45DRAFT_1374483 [Cubamyces sp. BRFM 1775]